MTGRLDPLSELVVIKEHFPERRWSAEARAMQVFDRHRKDDQPAFSGEIQNAERASNPKAACLGHSRSLPFIDEQHVGVD